MTSACGKHAIDIISLKRPTALDKLAETIPKPKGAVPNFGLPKWKEMPLESKIPMVPGPEGAYNFTRRKLGKRLWIPAADAEFNLSDPYCYEIEFTYDSLHDNHLIPYFSRPNILQSLVKAGLVTKNLDAKCSLRDYNMYRKYLRRLHCDSIKKELSRKEKWSVEERAIQYAQDQADKEVRKLKEREKLMEKRRAIIRQREMAEKQKRWQQQEKQRKIEERLQTLIQTKREERYMQRIQIKARAEEIQQKQKAAAEIEREKIIQTLLEWKRKEDVRTRKREMRLSQEQKEKRETVEHKYMEKWQLRQEFQKKQIEKEQFLLQCIEDQRAKFKAAYNAKVDKETQRMQRLLKDVKLFIKCYLARRAGGSRERICCKKYLRDDDLDEIVASGKYDKRRTISRLTSDVYTSSTLTKGDRKKRGKGKISIQSDASARASKVGKKKVRRTSSRVRRKSSRVRRKSSRARRASSRARRASSRARRASSRARRASSRVRKTSSRVRKTSSRVRKTSSKVKRKKSAKARKGSKRGKRGGKRKRSSRRRTKAEDESEAETVDDKSESATKVSEESDTDSTDEEKCRCLAIKQMQNISTV